MKRPAGRRSLPLLCCLCTLAVGSVSTLPLRGQVADTPPPSQNLQASPNSGTAGELAREETAPESKQVFEWKFAWKGWDGLQYSAIRHIAAGKKVETPSGANVFDFTQVAFTGKFGARFAGDGAAFWNIQNLQGADSGWEVRRARVYMAGDVVLVAPWSFKLEIGTTGGNFTLEESYVQFKNYPRLGMIQIGQFQAPMSHEAMMSSRDLTFMEQSSAVMALAPGVNTGIQLGRAAFHDRMTWMVGLFASAPVTDTGDASKEARRAMGRLTWLVKDGTGADVPAYLHLGLSGSYLFSGSDTVQYRSRPESHLAPYMVQTGDIKADSADTLGLEAIWVDGPVSVQGEYLRARVNKKSGTGANFWGAYVSASWLLTGESRPYSKAEGMFTRLRPFQNFTLRHGGRGALEVAVRYSIVDLNEGSVHGGKMHSLTAGLNWFINPNAKLRFNYVTSISDLNSPQSKLNIAEMRFEFDF